MMKGLKLFFPGAAALLSLSLLFSCGGEGGRAAREAEPARNIVIVESVAPSPSSEAQGAFPRRALPEGSAPFAERLASLLLELAGDPGVEAIVLSPAPKGTAEAFRRCREARPGLLLIAAEPEEDPLLIQSLADLAAQLRDGEAAASRALVRGLAELARRAVGKGARIDGLEDLVAALRAADPGTRWSASYYIDPESGLRARNQVIVVAAPKEQ